MEINMAVSLITGVSGQIGSYLFEQLAVIDHVIGICRNLKQDMTIPANTEMVSCNICVYDDVYKILKKYKPERIFHLAAYHFGAGPWNAPQDVIQTNVIGTINIFEAVNALRAVIPSYDPIIVITSTAMCYGASLKNINTPATEDLPLRPTTPYALSKTAQEALAEQYHEEYGIKTIRTRLFAVTSPKADHGSVFDFTRKAVMIENGILPDKLEVGDLNVYRSITHASDVASALVLLSESMGFGEVFNICGEEYYSVADVLEMVRSKARIFYEITTKVGLFPVSDRFLAGNSEKLRKTVNWKPEYSLEKMIDEMLLYFRKVENITCPSRFLV
jgi:nucleoside-diphosphate-sugar epimerase